MIFVCVFWLPFGSSFLVYEQLFLPGFPDNKEVFYALLVETLTLLILMATFLHSFIFLINSLVHTPIHSGDKLFLKAVCTFVNKFCAIIQSILIMLLNFDHPRSFLSLHEVPHFLVFNCGIPHELLVNHGGVVCLHP